MDFKKTCLYCKHFRFDWGWGVGGDYTPPESPTIECLKLHFHGLRDYDGKGALRAMISTAFTCPDFEFEEE